MQDIRKFHEAFYRNASKIEQDNFILKHTSQCTPKRKRPLKGIRNDRVAIYYFVKSARKGMVQVCSAAFQRILGISSYRIQNISKKFLVTGGQPKENRGGDRKSKKYANKTDKVMGFISRLKCVESHYTREKSQRQYMPSDCSIRKLWKLYCQENEVLKVKYEFFRKIFVEKFNISFKSPTTDACSECIRLKGLIKSEVSVETKSAAIIQLRVHKLKANAFYDSLKISEDHVIKLSFDCQKNMILPRVPDQQAYYSRQLYLYNYTICEGSSQASQNRNTVTSYTWTENSGTKSSNEISSMLYHKLSTLNFDDIHCIKFYCDGCPGQNKNVTLMGMLMKWLYSTKTSVKHIFVIYPIVGHSFLPPDRVFGRIEKDVKKKDTIILPSEYRDIFKQYATVLELGQDFSVVDWKAAVETVVKPPAQWHFQFSTAKRFCFKKTSNGTVFVRGEVNYKSDLGVYKQVLKKGKFLADINPELVVRLVKVKPQKLKDVDELLKKHFGKEWRHYSGVDLMFYSDIIDGVHDAVEANDEETDNIEEDDGLRI